MIMMFLYKRAGNKLKEKRTTQINQNNNPTQQNRTLQVIVQASQARTVASHKKKSQNKIFQIVSNLVPKRFFTTKEKLPYGSVAPAPANLMSSTATM